MLDILEKAINNSIDTNDKLDTADTIDTTDTYENNNTDYTDDTEILNTLPQEKTSDNDCNDSNNYNILAGGVDIVYNIEYILPEDEKLINVEKVIKQVDKYIDNYNSPQMIKYKQSFKQLYQKYSNKKYVIKTIKTKNNPIKIIVVKNDKIDKLDKPSEIIKEITKPIYLYYDEDYNITTLKKKISNSRTELQYKYETFTSKLNITPNEKKEFENDRNSFIELLEEYYIYTLYHKKINRINTTNKTVLLMQEVNSFYKENIETTMQMLKANLYSIDISTVDMINKLNIAKLTKYNDLILKLSAKDSKKLDKDKKIIDEIKSYLDKTESNIINENIKKIIQQQNAENIINYIVLSLPIL